MKRALFQLTLAIAAIIATLAVLEVLLRVAGFSATPVQIQAGRQTDQRTLHVFEDQNFEPDPDLIWRPRRNHSVFNSQGFRGPELTADKPAGTARVFTVGDSNTLGWAGEDGPNWPGELSTLIARDRAGVSVVNAGVWGYASYQGLRRFTEVLAWQPDMVFVSFGSNDAHFVLQSDKDYDARTFRNTGPGRAIEGFRLGELLLSALDRTPQASSLGPRVTLDDYRENLREIVRRGRAKHVQVILLTRPYNGAIQNETWWKNRGADYNTATSEIAAEMGVPLVDVYSYFKHLDEHFADESHFTAQGHKIAASIIYDHIKGLLK
jgi:lysophospholipase L1-like esterase